MNIEQLTFNIFDLIKVLSFIISFLTVYYKLNLKLEILAHSHNELNKKMDTITKIAIKEDE